MSSTTVANPKEALRIFEELDAPLKVAETTYLAEKSIPFSTVVKCFETAKRKAANAPIGLTQEEKNALEVALEEVRVSGKLTGFSAGPWSAIHYRLIREAFPDDEVAQTLHRRENDALVAAIYLGPNRQAAIGLLR